MTRWTRILFAPLVIVALAISGCTSGDGIEDKYDKALKEVNENWYLYEIGESRGAVVIKVEVSEIVSFDDGKKAVDAINKVDPSFAGYIDFYDSKTGTVVRKMEVIPSTPAT